MSEIPGLDGDTNDSNESINQNTNESVNPNENESDGQDNNSIDGGEGVGDSEPTTDESDNSSIFNIILIPLLVLALGSAYVVLKWRTNEHAEMLAENKIVNDFLSVSFLLSCVLYFEIDR